MPTLFVIVGPNGIGKTTSSCDIVPKNTPVINSDEIAKEARIAGLLTVNTQEYQLEAKKQKASKGIFFLSGE